MTLSTSYYLYFGFFCNKIIRSKVLIDNSVQYYLLHLETLVVYYLKKKLHYKLSSMSLGKVVKLTEIKTVIALYQKFTPISCHGI